MPNTFVHTLWTLPCTVEVVCERPVVRLDDNDGSVFDPFGKATPGEATVTVHAASEDTWVGGWQFNRLLVFCPKTFWPERYSAILEIINSEKQDLLPLCKALPEDSDLIIRIP